MTQCQVEKTSVHFWTFLPVSVNIILQTTGTGTGVSTTQSTTVVTSTTVTSTSTPSPSPTTDSGNCAECVIPAGINCPNNFASLSKIVGGIEE